MWEIAENLHRADLTVLERDEHIAEWVRLAGKNDDRVSVQLAPKLSSRGREGEGRPEGGINAAARELGVERTAAQRATKVAGPNARSQGGRPRAWPRQQPIRGWGFARP